MINRDRTIYVNANLKRSIELSHKVWRILSAEVNITKGYPCENVAKIPIKYKTKAAIERGNSRNYIKALRAPLEARMDRLKNAINKKAPVFLGTIG